MNEVYAIKYSERDGKANEHFYRSADCGSSDWPMAYYVWVVKTPNHGPIVLDTGYTSATADALGRPYLASPVDTLAELGVKAGEGPRLILSHLHFDHTGNVDKFEHSQVHVQQAEMRFWLGPHARLGEYPELCAADDLAALIRANLEGRVHWLDGDFDIAPGVTVHHVGGHTPGSQVVRVDTRQGVVVLAADASHFYANIEGNRPYAIVNSLPDMYRAFETIQALAGPDGTIVPGHDPLVMTRFPAADPALEGSVVRVG